MDGVTMKPTAERPMKFVIQVHRRDSAKTWGLLVRHSPGVALADRMFVVSAEAARALRKTGVRFKQVSRDATPPGVFDLVRSVHP
jgi:hypothetical protein